MRTPVSRERTKKKPVGGGVLSLCEAAPAARCLARLGKRGCERGARQPTPGAAMYYRFSGFTQRLVGAGASAAYAPQGFKPVTSVESPPLIFGTPTKIASEAPPTVEFLGKNKVPDLQKFFQKPDGVPVHLKRGLPDQLLYRTTMALTIGGTIYCLIALYMAAHPKRQK